MNKTQLARLMHDAKHNTYTPHGDISRADCVIGFSFGFIQSETGILPGESNRQLASFIERNFPDTPLILQFEITDALASRTTELTIKASRKQGEYLNSREIAEQALERMKARGWKSAAIVTHPAMMSRNDAICQKLGIEVVTPPGLETIPYDENSAQIWTRNAKNWWRREMLVIPVCQTRGWI